jgi:hypothetical protein
VAQGLDFRIRDIRDRAAAPDDGIYSIAVDVEANDLKASARELDRHWQPGVTETHDRDMRCP